MEARYTAWHYFLAEVMQHLIDERNLEVHPFEKLGTLPLEADIILLKRQADKDLAALYPEFDFLMRHLGWYTVVEYKSPEDRLTHEDPDTVRAYAMLCKRKFGITLDRGVRVAMLYSHLEGGFFEVCQDAGMYFHQVEPGIRRCDMGSLVMFTMDLVALGEADPSALINLFSSRRRQFVVSGKATPGLLRVIRYVYEHVFKRFEMKHSELRNLPEFTQDMDEIRRRLLQGYTVEERLEGLSTEEIRRRLSPEERLEGLSTEEILAGLSPEELDKLRKLLEQKNH